RKRSGPPANATVCEFVPHSEVLERATCAITHGGMGVTQKALGRGVPVTVVPYGRDQFGVARRVEVTKCGTRAGAQASHRSPAAREGSPRPGDDRGRPPRRRRICGDRRRRPWCRPDRTTDTRLNATGGLITRHSVLLVPGAYHKPSHMDPLVTELSGIDVHTVTLTSSGDDPAALKDMHADAEVIAQAAAAIDGP